VPSRTAICQGADGTTTEMMFVGEPGRRLFSVLHRPHLAPVGAVLICSPLHAEMLKNNRREVLLSRALAAHGLAVLRFHYRGTGNSDGDAGDLDLEVMIEDAGVAASILGDAAGGVRVGVHGTRLAALVAAAAAGPGSPLSLWEPSASGSRYIREVARAGKMLDLAAGKADSTQRDDVDPVIAGFSIGRALRESASSHNLDLAERTGPLLVVSMRRGDQPATEMRRLAEETAKGGSEVTLEHLDYEEAWWFHEDVDRLTPTQARLASEEVVRRTAAWWVGVMGGA
jgi:hypothetical protein